MLFAPNVHTGGGLTLLRSLMDAWPGDRPCQAFLDRRAQTALRVPAGWSVEWCEPTLVGRLRAEWQLRRSAHSASIVLCFHNLPPLLPIAGRKLCLIQNRNVLEPSGCAGMPMRVRLRTWLEHVLVRGLSGRIDRYFVQTPSMARAAASLRRRPDADIVVAPFAPSLEVSEIPPAKDAPRWDFICVADGQTHKNHGRLIQAWQLLAETGLFPTLALTLGPRDQALASELLGLATGLGITNLGELPHSELLALYRDTRALIFPSTVESFGLPLIEAAALGLPIIASELDFVRDVCVPAECFDPLSPTSIARAVQRFLQQPEQPGIIEDAAQFVERILEERSGH